MNFKKALLVLSLSTGLALPTVSADQGVSPCLLCEEALRLCSMEGKGWYECLVENNWCPPC